MGLCKCPKRLVTNQFCYEHRVNVCENCMLKSHQKCIIQSYIQWLKDSDYNSSCQLCGELLESDECIRLTCYHIFHWKCLNSRQSQLPTNTAPGGHNCPTCSENILPLSNLVSPVADVLRNKLAQVNWGRSELSLPLFAEETNQIFASPVTTSASSISSVNHSTGDSSLFKAEPSVSVHHKVINIDSSSNFQNSLANSRRPLLARESPIGSSDRDDDQNKYKRKSPLELLSRWSRTLYSPSSRPPWRRTWFIVLAGIFVFLLLIYIMAKLGRGGSSGDEDYDFRHE